MLKFNTNIIKYLNDIYQPQTILVYGSFATGTNRQDSDFDALIITDQSTLNHDHSVIDGIQLDVWITQPSKVEELKDYSKILQIHDAIIIKDTHQMGQQLIDDVRNYVKLHSTTDLQTKDQLISWCYKMLNRAKSQNTEGYYRWHWLLVDSLDIYCQLRDYFYFGPRKTLDYLKALDPKGYHLYQQSLSSLDYHDLEQWIEYLVCN